MEAIHGALLGVLVLWGAVTAVLIGLLAYRGTLEIREDDQIFLDRAGCLDGAAAGSGSSNRAAVDVGFDLAVELAVVFEFVAAACFCWAGAFEVTVQSGRRLLPGSEIFPGRGL